MFFLMSSVSNWLSLRSPLRLSNVNGKKYRGDKNKIKDFVHIVRACLCVFVTYVFVDVCTHLCKGYQCNILPLLTS